MRWTGVALLPIALIAAACGPARGSSSAARLHVKSAAIPVDEVTTKIAGATPKQEEILREILAGIGGSGFDRVEVREAEGDPAAALVVPYDPEGDMQALWEAWLLAHAFSARSKELGLPRVTQLVPAGDEADADILGDPPAKEPLDVEVALRRAEDAAKTAEQFGASVRKIEVLEPGGMAFVIELQVNSDEAHFLRDGLPRVLESVGEPPEPVDAGDYTLVRDSSRGKIWEGATASLGDAISITDWTKPAFAGCYSLHLSSGPFGKGPGALGCED